MGWNNIKLKNNRHPILRDIKEDEDFYFANSYHFVCQNENNVLAYTDYGQRINSILSKDNILAVQFHPEKSGEAGLRILKNFINWRP
ncbi:MAG: glutamine amidotransferase-related protein [Alphaproteobacteria bacterium]